MQTMTPPPTPGPTSNGKKSPSTKSEKRRRREATSKEKHRHRTDKAGKKHRRKVERSRKKHERRKERDLVAKRLANDTNHEPREQLEPGHEISLDEEATVLRKLRRSLSPVNAIQHTRTSTIATPRRPTPSPAHDHPSDRGSSIEHKHRKKSHHQSRGTPKDTVPFIYPDHLSTRTSKSNHKHKHKHSKKRNNTSRNEPTAHSVDAKHISLYPQDGDSTTSNSESSHERQLEKLMDQHLSRAVPTLNPLERLLALPTYQPDPNNSILSSAYTFIGAMQAEQLNLHDQSADIEFRINTIRDTPWKLDIRQQEELERLRDMREACEGLAMDLMLEEGAFEDVYEKGRGKAGFELGREVERLRGRVVQLMEGYQERIEVFEGSAGR
ncbi:hypothetical protein DE146DRAFT_455391 [Phaeosphaeria sp. MPI-PUGE-AT-0046c]|nr:hypothetical protein DE146DRAFT_455391 [Phaeosphaeria sp. MPI-PUGE-AT-0046c]